jgi:hypothetical protein
LKIYNRDFAQVRELTFALVAQPEDVDKLEEFAPQFADALRQQPWCARVLSGSPIESPEGVRDLQAMAVPLLLNLEPAAFDETLASLRPERIQERLTRLREEIEGGSPRPQFELTLDPLGVITPALKPFAANASMADDQPLTSPDRTMRVFITVTNQPSIDAFECQKLMDQVNAFRATAAQGWDGGRLEVLVTGRSAYVAEISLAMRHDIVVTILGSVFLVGGVFYIGFKRWLPLLGVGFTLLFCCLVSLAAGLLIFGELNLVTIGFCAILIGLGIDFGILVFGRYQQARDDGHNHAPAISESIQSLGTAVFFGALTTAVGFLALLLSNSAGFTQLGVLIAIGIFLAGLFMMSVFFLFLPEKSEPRQHDWIFTSVKRYVRWTVRKPSSMLWIAVPVLGLLTIIAISPKPPLIFDASTRSMEPKSSAASYALHTIMAKMPTRWEPAIGIVQASNAQELHDHWQKILARWTELQEAARSRASPRPPRSRFAAPERRESREARQCRLRAARRRLETAVEQSARGFTPETSLRLRHARRAGHDRQRDAAVKRLAQPPSESVKLVVPGRPLLRARSPAHDWVRDDARADHDSEQRRMLTENLPVGRCADDTLRVEFHAHGLIPCRIGS